MSTIASLDVDLALNTAKFVEGVHKARKEHQDLVKQLTNIGSQAGDFAESLGINSGGSFGIATLVEKAKEAEESQARLQAVLLATGQAAGINAAGMERIAAELSRVTTFGREAAVSAETVLATFSHVRGDQFREAVKAAADLATVFKVDLTEAARTLGRALENPEDGLRRLARMGVQFSEDQKETIKSLVEMGDTAAAQQKILDAVNAKVGGSATAVANTASGHYKQLQNAIEHVAASAGQVLLPAIKEAESVVTGIKTAVGAAKDAWNLYTQAQELATAAARAFETTPIGALLAAAGLAIAAITALLFQMNQESVAHDEAAEAARRHADALEEVAAAAEKILQDNLKKREAMAAGFEQATERQEPLSFQISQNIARERDHLATMLADAKARQTPFGLHDKDQSDLARQAAVINSLEKSLREAQAQELGKEISAHQDELKRQADAVKAALLTPSEKLQETVAKLKELLTAGAISPSQYAASLRKTYGDAANAATPPQLAAAALAQGSVAAYSAALRNDAASHRSPELEVLNKQLSEAQKQTGNLEDIKKALLEVPTPTEVSVN